MLLAEDETDLLLFPPLRATWGIRGVATQVVISGRNARRVIFGAMNLHTGKRLFLTRMHQRQDDFQSFLRLVHHHYRGWHVSLLLDEDPSHTAKRSRQVAINLDINLIWLPKRAPELNPMDELWGQAKDIVSANIQYASIDEHTQRFLTYLNQLSNRDALLTAGLFSKTFWLNSVLSKNFWPPA